jgi:hypothetical protein
MLLLSVVLPSAERLMVVSSTHLRTDKDFLSISRFSILSRDSRLTFFFVSVDIRSSLMSISSSIFFLPTYPIHLSLSLSLSLSIDLSVYIRLSVSLCLSLCLSVCLSPSLLSLFSSLFSLSLSSL